MRWPIRNQIFVPFAALLLAATMSIALTVAVLAARRSAIDRVEQLHRVQATLSDATFPFTQSVLQKMRGLSGADFIALDARGEIVTSTFSRPLRRRDLPAHLPPVRPSDHRGDFDEIDVDGVRSFAATLPGNHTAGVSSVLILYSKADLRQAQWEAAWPPLAIGGATIPLVIAISAWLSRRLGRRIETLRALFGHIADGQFTHAAAAPPRDEIYELVQSANRLSDQLSSMRAQVAQSERMRLLAQLAGGLAHQLRNAVTGARMAVQLHQRRCPSSGQDESLAVALRQLTLTEEQVRGLLSLGRPRNESPRSGRLPELLADIDRLIAPAAQHAHVAWTCQFSSDVHDIVVADADGLRGGLLNLALNAIEAAGSGGRVALSAERTPDRILLRTTDTGSGPPAHLAATIFDPFVTGKQEGIGLGLALAQAAAVENGGDLAWSREQGLTVFTMSVCPSSTPAPHEFSYTNARPPGAGGSRSVERGASSLS